MVRSYVEEIETSQKLSSESSEDRCENKDEKKSVSKENSAEILDVENKFVVPPLSELICTIGMSANKSGKFSKNLKLSVIGTNLELPLMVRGTAVGNYFSVSPQTMSTKKILEKLQLNIASFTFAVSSLKILDELW